MLKIGKKYLKPHFCPDCHKLVILTRHPLNYRCKTCHRRHKRHTNPSPSTKNRKHKYSKSYKRKAQRLISQHHFCALCGTQKNLTCHHAVRVKDGWQKDLYLTVLCDSCHRLWEQKVNMVRSALKQERSANG